MAIVYYHYIYLPILEELEHHARTLEFQFLQYIPECKIIKIILRHKFRIGITLYQHANVGTCPPKLSIPSEAFATAFFAVYTVRKKIGEKSEYTVISNYQ